MFARRFADALGAFCQESLVFNLSRDWSLQGGVFETVVGINAGRELAPMVAVWYHF